MAYPRSLNDIRNYDESEGLYAELFSNHLLMKSHVIYSVLVKGMHGKEQKKRFYKEVNIMKCALNYT
jgi:hypothetical protein